MVENIEGDSIRDADNKIVQTSLFISKNLNKAIECLTFEAKLAFI